MKKGIMVVLLFNTVMLSQVNMFARNGNPEMQALVARYFGIKDALVSGNVSGAVSNAAGFVKAIGQFDPGGLSAAKQKSVQPMLAKLSNDADAISAAKDIERQRELFASLSEVMINLAKEIKFAGTVLYVDYCPMKKSFWLSAEKPIKNPYYGNSMITCGKITDTLK
jgi:hypothetical protein